MMWDWANYVEEQIMMWDWANYVEEQIMMWDWANYVEEQIMMWDWANYVECLWGGENVSFFYSRLRWRSLTLTSLRGLDVAYDEFCIIASMQEDETVYVTSTEELEEGLPKPKQVRPGITQTSSSDALYEVTPV
jgi:hypothetical protein